MRVTGWLAAIVMLLGGCSNAPEPGVVHDANVGATEPVGAVREEPEGSRLVRLSTYEGAPAGATPTKRGDGKIVPLAISPRAKGEGVRVTAWGSGSCPPFADHARVNRHGTVLILVATAYQGACTSDVRPATTVVEFPHGSALDPSFRLVFIASGATRFSLRYASL